MAEDRHHLRLLKATESEASAELVDSMAPLVWDQA